MTERREILGCYIRKIVIFTGDFLTFRRQERDAGEKDRGWQAGKVMGQI